MAKRSAIVMYLFVGLFAIWMSGCETQEKKVERLIGELQDKDEDVRRWAARALGEIGTPKAIKAAVPALIQALQDQDKSVRRWAARDEYNIHLACGIVG